MNKAFEKILERLENIGWVYADYYPDGTNISRISKKSVSYDEVIKIVQEIAEEYNGGWIPCSERLPEKSGEYLTWVEYDGDRFIAIDEIDCDGIIKEWNCSTDYKIIAWQHLPEPFKERD